jgi:hypothetical protein
MKKFLTCIFMTLGSFLWADTPMMNIPQVDPFELLNNMDPKELDKLMEDLAKMSPEEIKYYEDLGKQMFKQSGYDLDEIAKTFPAPAPVTPQPARQPEAPVSKTPKQEKPKPVLDEPSKKEKDSLLRMVKALSESLASIRQKAASDETLHPHLAPLQQELDLLTAYVNRLDYERHLKHFGEKEFASLKTKLRKMSSMLEEFDNNLVVPELTLRKVDNRKASSYGAQVQQATSIIKEFKNYMSKAFTTDTIITDIESLFKKHDQEALTIKKEIEERQKKAAEQVKKLSTTNTGKFAPIPKITNQPAKPGHGPGGSAGSASRPGMYHPGANSSNQPTPGTSAQQQAAKGKNAAPTKPGEKTKEQKDAENKTREKKDNDFAEVPLTPQEALEKAKKDLRAVNVEVARNKQDLLRFADDLTTKQTSIEADREALLKIVQLMKETHETLEKYFKTLSKEKNTAVITKNKKMLKDSFETQSPELKEVYDKFTALDFSTFPQPFTEDMDTSKELVDGFKKYYTSIGKQLKPTRF